MATLKMYLKACKYSLKSFGFYLWMSYLGMPAVMTFLKGDWWLGILILVLGGIVFPMAVLENWRQQEWINAKVDNNKVNNNP